MAVAPIPISNRFTTHLCKPIPRPARSISTSRSCQRVPPTIPTRPRTITPRPFVVHLSRRRRRPRRRRHLPRRHRPRRVLVIYPLSRHPLNSSEVFLVRIVQHLRSFSRRTRPLPL